MRDTEASEPLFQLLEAKPCASVVINIWRPMDGLVRVIQCILRWRVVYQQRVLDNCVRESLKDPAQWFYQDRLPWIHVVNTFCLVAVLLPKYIVSRDIQAGLLLDFIHVPLHLLIPTGRPKHDKEMMNTGG
jgi:hypothetical protein